MSRFMGIYEIESRLKRKNSKKDKLKYYALDFCNKTSIHGVQGLLASRSPFERFLWVCVLMICSGSLTVQIFLRIVQLNEQPVSTAVQPNDERMKEPKIVICNTAAFSISKYAYASDFYQFSSNWRVKNLNATLKAKYNFTLAEFHLLASAGIFGNDDLVYVTVDNAIGGLIHAQELIGHEKETMILRCRYKDVQCNYTHFTAISTEKFPYNCFLMEGIESLETQATEIQPYSLDLILFGDATLPQIWRDYYINELSYDVATNLLAVTISGKTDYFIGNGLEVYVENENAVMISPGEHTIISLNSETVKKQNRRSYRCSDKLPTTSVINPFTQKIETWNLTSSTYHNVLLQKELKKQCNCYAFFLPLLADSFNRSSINQSDFCFNLERFETESLHLDLNKMKSCITSATSQFDKQYYSNSGLWRKVVVPCSYIQYRLDVSHSKWPATELMQQTMFHVIKEAKHLLRKKIFNYSYLIDFLAFYNITKGFKEKLVDSEEYFTRNFYRLTITTRNRHTLRIEEVFTDSLTSFFSDLGGLLGLWVGASVITLSEVAVFFWNSVCLVLLPKSLLKGKSKQSQDFSNIAIETVDRNLSTFSVE